ncbi:unnamed protein product [Triticum turgidum subsp. durum]|uniref:Myosin motor domain-containing protein n=1 Tax=Triticum turgidum subsp. durum TaxID=4567 RepID=A0A9R0XHP0_TRITD|nr:unnamed protein product [Triticum turgidum subsp. durum]
MGLKGYQIGKTKVFLRAGQMAELDARRAEVLANAVRLIQRRIRTHLMRKEFVSLKKASIQTQKFWRARLARKLFEHMRRVAAAITIQKHTRTHSAWKAYLQIYRSSITIQTGLRAMAARKEHRFRRETKATIINPDSMAPTQSLCCLQTAKKSFSNSPVLVEGTCCKEGTSEAQNEARDNGALKEAKDKLEKRVEELTWRLDVEKHLRVDLEVAKGQEITKLQSALQEMQEKLEEAHAAIINEKESAKLAIEQAPPKIVEVPVVDNAKVELLTSQNEELETELGTFRTKAEDLEKKLFEIKKQSDELSREAQERDCKINELQEMIASLRQIYLTWNLKTTFYASNHCLHQQMMIIRQNK